MHESTEFTASAALAAWERGELEAWIHAFLAGEGNNLAFSEGLRIEPRRYTKPVDMALGRFQRIVGPGPEYKYQVPADGFEERVNAIRKRLAGAWDMPPLIINYDEGAFHLTDGNHRHEALLRSGRTHHPVILWTTGAADAEELDRLLV